MGGRITHRMSRYNRAYNLQLSRLIVPPNLNHATAIAARLSIVSVSYIRLLTSMIAVYESKIT